MNDLVLQRNQERNTEDNLRNESSLISKIAKTAVSIAVTNKVLNKTKMKNFKNKNALGFGLGIMLNAINDEDEGDFTNTLIAGSLLVGGSKLAKDTINQNGEQITKSLFSLNQKNKNFREAIFDFNQKRKEVKAGIHKFKDIEEKVDFYFDIKTKSKAFQIYEDNKETANFIKYTNAKKGYVDPIYGDYFKKKEQINKRGGFGFFDRTLKNLKVDDTGKIVFNEKQILLNSRTEFNVMNTFINHFKKELEIFSDNYDKDKGFGMNQFIEHLEKVELDKSSKDKKNDYQLVIDFKKHYEKISSNKKNGVKLKDILDQDNIYKSFSEKTKGLDFLRKANFDDKNNLLNIDDFKIAELFGDINIKDLSKDKQGKIFDSSILDIENLFLDTMQMIDKSIRPPFSFIPGERQNFSLVPFDIKARILSKESSDFKIIQTDIDYDATLRELEEQKKLIKKNSYKYLNIDKDKLSNNKESLISDIDEKINYYTYEKEFIKNNMNTNDDFKKTKLKFFINESEDGILSITESKERDIKAYINNDKKLNYLSNENVWNQKEGTYGFTYSKMFKENEISKYNASLANDFGEFGQFEEGLNDSSGYGLLKSKFHNWTDKNKTIFSQEVNDDINKLKIKRDNLINDLYETKYKNNYSNVDSLKEAIYNNDIILDNSELKTLINTEKAYLYKSNINSKSIFDLDINNTEHLKDLKDADISVKEHFIKSLLNTDFFNNNKDNFFNGKHFNMNYLKENYYKSLVPSKRGMLYKESENIKDWFNTNANEIGTIENSYFNNFLNKFENSLNFIGINKLNPSDNYSTDKHMANVMLKRVMPFLGMLYGYKAIEGLTDVLTPDDTPLGNAGIGGVAAKMLAGTRLGFQIIAENTGIKGATQYLIDQGLGFLEVTDLNLSSEEMYQRYFEGKLTPIRRNRYWFSSGRNGFEGDDIKEYREHFLYKMQNRDSMFYNNKLERFYREDFLPTKLLSRTIDPYLEERRLFEKGLPLDKSEQLFRDIPIFGEALSATIGQMIKPTIYYTNDTNEFSAPLRVLNTAFEDIKSFGGLQGYALSKATDYLFGAKSIKDLMMNAGFETRELASVDAITGLSEQYDALELGGMFGYTEPIRRLLSNNNKDRKSNMESQLPDWFSATNRLNNLELLNNNNLNPINYKNKYGTNIDSKYKDFGLLDRLRIMSTTNPNSKEFFNYKNMALANLNNGKYNASQITNIYQSISIAENISGYNEYKKDLYVDGASFDKMNLQIDNVISHNEFISNGKRIKLAGITDDFDFVSRKVGATKALEEKIQLKNLLSNTSELNVTINSDMLKNVKSDSKGQYLEVFDSNIYNNTDFKERTYFEQSQNGIFKNGINKYFDLAVSQTFDVSKNKFFSNKSAYDKWEDNLTIPNFRDWDNPYDSFIKPLGNLGAGDLSQKFLAQQMLAQNSLTKDMSLSSGLGASYILGNSLLGNGKSNYDKESNLNKLYQQTLYNNNINNTFEINEQSTNTAISKTLTQNDEKYFYNLVNEVNDSKIQNINNFANEELKKAMNIINNKKMNYLYNTNLKTQNEELPEKENPEFKFEYNYFYNIGKIKQENNMPLTMLEKRKLNNHYFDINKFNMQISQEEIRRRIYGNKKTKITSTIYDSNNTFNY